MKKIIYISSIFVAVILLIYTIAWFVITITISNKLNQQYANHYINSRSIGMEQQYFIKFNKIANYGFPFKIAIQIIGWYEESDDTIIEFNTPIYIGYDLLKQSCFISYSGDATGSYKPTELKFGSKFKSANYSITAKIPLSFKLLKIFTEKKDPFEIINFIRDLEFRSENTQIFDLYNQEKLYDEDHTIISFSFEKSKYYTSIEDFSKNIPQKLNIKYSTKILKSDILNRKIPAGMLLYRFAWPFAFNFQGEFYIKTNKSLFSDFTKDLEIKVISAKSSSDIQESLTNLLYRSKSDENNRDTYLTINSKFDLKSGFSDNLLNFINYILPYIPLLPKNLSFVEELKYISDNKNIFSLTELENRQYIFDLTVNFIARNQNAITVQIDNLSLFSNNTGLRLSKELKINLFGNFDIKGLVILNNYPKIIDLVNNYYFNLGRFKEFSSDSRNLYQQSTKYFLKTISDHPDSNSNDISFEYQLNSNNIEKGKIGTVDFNKIVPLYYLALYRKASEKIHIGDNIVKKMQELIPDFNKHQKLLQQLMIQPFHKVDDDTWQEIIK